MVECLSPCLDWGAQGMSKVDFGCVSEGFLGEIGI